MKETTKNVWKATKKYWLYGLAITIVCFMVISILGFRNLVSENHELRSEIENFENENVMLSQVITEIKKEDDEHYSSDSMITKLNETLMSHEGWVYFGTQTVNEAEYYVFGDVNTCKFYVSEDLQEFICIDDNEAE